MRERDERPLDEIQFAIDGLSQDREVDTGRIRDLLRFIGVSIAQDIIDLGCTGLTEAIQDRNGQPGRCVWMLGKTAIEIATWVRERMAGSICGLPCYVPPNRYCLVHDTIGALQLDGNLDGIQQVRHPEGISLCSRELTDEECKQYGAVQKKRAELAKKFGIEGTLNPVDLNSRPLKPQQGSDFEPSPAITDRFKCPEHLELNPSCRFCLAQAVAEGPLEPNLHVRVYSSAFDEKARILDPRELETVLKHNGDNHVQLYVLAASWTRKLARD
jgi:hypothetical protein